MRVVVRNLILEDPALVAEIPADRWFGSGSVPDTPPRPFAEIRFGGTFPGMAHITRRRLEVWIHDDEGDYGRIDKIIGLLKKVLDGAEHVQGEDSELIRASWVGDSTDLYDDGYRTNTKSTGFDVVGTGD